MMKYRLLGRSGLRVSEICLGTMTFGEDWGWGSSKEESRKVFQAYVKAGGNFLDTANNYTNGTSETLLGEFLGTERQRFVIGTKFTLSMNKDDINAGGNHRKNIRQSLEASLKRLKTDYIDLYTMHIWDKVTPIEEVIRTLDDLVAEGKVLYAGISDTPAWVVSRANTIAELRGWSPFVAFQVEYSLIQRTPEREILPMSKALGLGVTAWAPLAGGLLTGKYNSKSSSKKKGSDAKRLDVFPGYVEQSDRNFRIVEEVQKIALETGQTPAQVALNWVRQKENVIPIIGSRKLEQIRENLDCLKFELNHENLERLDEVSKFDLGFPNDFLNKPNVQELIWGSSKERFDEKYAAL